jgi:hypothetical protein
MLKILIMLMLVIAIIIVFLFNLLLHLFINSSVTVLFNHLLADLRVTVLYCSSLDKDLFDVALDLRCEQVSQLPIKLVLERELPRQLVGLVTLKHLDVLLLTTTDVYGNSEELVTAYVMSLGELLVKGVIWVRPI